MASETQFTGYACKGKGQPLELWSYTPRPLGEHDVEIKISHCGICHSDIHTLDSGWGPTAYPCIVGHEIVGTVEAAGEKSLHKVGDRVAVGAQVGACFDCGECSSDRDQHCAKGVFTYNSKYPDGAMAYGGYQHRVRVDSRYAFKLPESLPSESGAPLLCAGVTVYAPLARAGVKEGVKVGVIGLGGLGHLAVAFSSKMGGEVTVFSTSDRKKEDALKLGASNFIISSDPAAMQAAGRSLDVIICTVSEVLDYASYFATLKVGGTFIVVGIPEKPLPLPVFPLIINRVNFCGSLIGSRKEIEDCLEVAAKHNITAWTSVMPMSQVNDALDLARANKARYRIVLANDN